MNNDAKTILEILKKDAAGHKFDLQQGTFLPEPASKQLHQNRNTDFKDFDCSDFFLLVTKVNKNYCEVIPGSLNGVMAGPNDIILPKNILGNYVFISPEMKTTVPKECLAASFAALDDELYHNIITQCNNLQNTGKFENSPFSEALPYISDNDDRIAYHNKLQKHVKSMQQSGRIIVFHPNMIAKAAGFIFVGALITFTIWNPSENYNHKVSGYIACTEQKEIHSTEKPTIVFRSKYETPEAEVKIYSPRKVIFNDKPIIQISGKEYKTYKLTIINNITSEQIASVDIKANQPITWNEISSVKLDNDDTYTLQIFDGEKTYKSDFWLADNNCRQEIHNEFAMLNNKYQNITRVKTGFSTIAIGGSGFAMNKAVDINKNDDINALKAFEFAKILAEKDCYSDAFVIIDNILKKHPENKEYKEFRKKCIEKLK